MRVRNPAVKQFPNETLSRGEICRRYVLAGVTALPKVPEADRARLAYRYRASMEAGEEG